MILQGAKHTCGPCALVNALQAAGHQTPGEESASKLCKASPIRGTSPGAIRAALRALGVSESILRSKSSVMAACALTGALESGTSAVLIVDNGSHYIAAVGVLGSRVLVCDSADGALVSSVTREDLLRRWACDGVYYAILVGQRVAE